MSEYRLVMKGVVKTFPGVKALDHAQLELRPGKVMALMGENGAGKSTLMKCMFGIYKMDEGEIEYEGQKVNIPTPLDALDRGIAMVHQELQPIPARTVAENIWLGRYPTKKYGVVTVVDHAKMYKDTDELLNKPTEVPLDQLNARAKHALMGNLGIQYTYASEDRVEATMPVDERTRQPFGILHGGATLALAETVAGLGSMILAKPDEMVVGMQVSGSHMSSAHEGDTVRAVGTIIHKGRSSHVWNVDIFTSTDKLVSSVRVINSILKKK